MNTVVTPAHIEALVMTPDGRRLLGQISAAEGLNSILLQHLSMLDIEQAWIDEIESARLEKLRDMAGRDTDATMLYAQADTIMQRSMRQNIDDVLTQVPNVVITSDSPALVS